MDNGGLRGTRPGRVGVGGGELPPGSNLIGVKKFGTTFQAIAVLTVGSVALGIVVEVDQRPFRPRLSISQSNDAGIACGQL